MDVASLWDFADPAASAARFADALADAPEPDALVLRTQLARALGLQGLYGAAWAELDLVAAAGSGDLEVTVREALERGRVLRDSTDLQGTSPGTAADHVARAARLAAGSTDPDIAGLHVDALHMLALLADTPQEQVRLTEQALAVATTSTAAPARRWRASLLNNLGMAHHDTGDDEAALVSFERALDLRRAAAGGDADPQVSVARWMVAWASRLLGRVEEALAEQTALAADNAAAGRPDPYVHDELAELFALQPESVAQEQARWHRDEAARLRT